MTPGRLPLFDLPAVEARAPETHALLGPGAAPPLPRPGLSPGASLVAERFDPEARPAGAALVELLVLEVEARGFRLVPRGEHVDVTTRPGAAAPLLTTEEAARIRERKPAVLDYLRQRAEATTWARMLGQPHRALRFVVEFSVPWHDETLFLVPSERDAAGLFETRRVGGGFRETTVARGRVWTVGEILALYQAGVIGPGQGAGDLRRIAETKLAFAGNVTATATAAGPSACAACGMTWPAKPERGPCPNCSGDAGGLTL